MSETIAAIATPVGEGGVGVIRVSGDDAQGIVSKFFTGVEGLRPRELTLGRWIRNLAGRVGDGEGTNDEIADVCMVVHFPAPNSYTGEDVVEIHAHGGSFHLRSLLRNLLDGGARLAQPGEFTKRAFLNGKLDLTQAEAVADLISSRSELSRKAAARQLAGGLFARIDSMRREIVDLCAQSEAAVDFPAEESQIAPREEQLKQVDKVLAEMSELLKTADTGRIVREGLRVAIVGRPNVGKSSLLNALLGTERAIVTATEGTTRDYLEEIYQVNGFPVVLIDTAGIRDSNDEIESEGILRSTQQLDGADLRLVVLDCSEELRVEDKFILERSKSPRLVLCNKCDLDTKKWSSEAGWLMVSAIQSIGLDEVKEKIVETALGSQCASMLGQNLLTQARHEDAMKRAEQSLIHVRETLNSGDLGPEFVAGDLRAVLDSLGEIVGITTRQEVLNTIFEKFCIGK